MRLTIIPVDKKVVVNGQSYGNLNLSGCNIPENVHALQWYETQGEIEFVGPAQNEPITTLPDWADACVGVWNSKDYEIKNPPPPTEEEIIISNQLQAKYFLQQSDWAALPDVGLVNKSEWATYRNALRQIAVNEILNPVWPTKPQAIWS